MKIYNSEELIEEKIQLEAVLDRVRRTRNMIFYLKAEVYTALTSSTPILRIIRFPNNADVWEECYLGIGYSTEASTQF